MLTESNLRLAALVAATAAIYLPPGKYSSSGRPLGDTCSTNILARAAATDTTHLRRVEWDSAPTKSAEGGHTTVFYEGARPRVVVVMYYGETGRTVARYYLATPGQYLVEQEVVEYAEPITANSQPTLKSRRPSTLYVCGGAVQDGLVQDELATLQADLDSVLQMSKGRR